MKDTAVVKRELRQFEGNIFRRHVAIEFWWRVSRGRSAGHGGSLARREFFALLCVAATPTVLDRLTLGAAYSSFRLSSAAP